MDTVEALGSSATTVRGSQAPATDSDPSPPVRCAWDLVTVPSRQGLEAADILRLRTGVGPVLHERAGDTLGFLVPAGTAEAWDVPGSACCEALARGHPQAPAGRWIVPPGPEAAVTDPALLRDALGEAARTLEAARR